MFPLGSRSSLPASRAEFESALREGLAVFRAPDLRVAVAGEFPNFSRVAIDLSGGSAPFPPPEVKTSGAQTASLGIGEFELVARPLLIESARAQVQLRASDVRMLLRGGSGASPASLEIASVRAGEFLLQTTRDELAAIITAVANRAASAHGVSVKRTQLSIASTGARSVRFTAEVLAQKSFMQTAIKLSGALAVDDQLNARLSDLDCTGGGIIGSLACNFLKPYIARFEGEVFPLAAFGLGDVRVRELTLDAGDPLQIRASFGNG